MDLMESWPDVAVQQVPDFAIEYCRVMREAFQYVPDALSQPDSYHVWRGIHLGYAVAGPIAPPVMTAPRDDGDPAYADLVIQLPAQLPRALSDANIHHLWRWMALGASTADPINQIYEDDSANSFVSGRQPAHDDDDYDGADDNQPNADDGSWSGTSWSPTWPTLCSTTRNSSDSDLSWEGDRMESDVDEAWVVQEEMERDVHRRVQQEIQESMQRSIEDWRTPDDDVMLGPWEMCA
jgi:hypothetical protein